MIVYFLVPILDQNEKYYAIFVHALIMQPPPLPQPLEAAVDYKQ